MMEHYFLLIVCVIVLCSNANIELTGWNTPTPAPFSWDWHRGFYSALDNSVYLIGLDASYKLDMFSRSWSSVSGPSGSLADGQWNVVLNNIFYFLDWDNSQYIKRYNPQTESLNTYYVSIGYVDSDNKGRCLTTNNIDIIYILGENTKFRYFNISKNTVSISSGTSIPSPGTDFGACGYYNGWIYMFGGTANANKIRKFNVGLHNEYISTNSWQLLSETMPSYALNQGEAVLIDNYFVMGLFVNSGYRNKVYVFDTSTDTFISTTTTNTQRRYGALVYIPTEDRVCAFLGRSDSGYGLSNYECSNTLHTASPTLSPIPVPTASPTAPTTALPTPTRTITTIDGTWYDDHEMVNSTNVIGWTMSKQIITNGLSTYYGPFTETSTTYYYISRQFQCKHTSAFSISYQEMHCQTYNTDHIKTIYPGNTAGNTYLLQYYDQYIQDSTLTSAANGACSGNSWERTSQTYNTQTVIGGTVFTIEFEIYVTETEDYAALYDIQITCDSLSTSEPTISPTLYPTFNPTEPTINPTEQTLNPTSPTLYPTTPTFNPTAVTSNPTESTLNPTEQTLEPTSPTLSPTTPTFNPIAPTSNPTKATPSPTEQTLQPTLPTLYPTTPTFPPTASTRSPSLNPTTFPSMNPTKMPSRSPTLKPSVVPTKSPLVEGRIEDETSTTSDNDANYGEDEALQAKGTTNWIYIAIGVVLSLCIICISIVFCTVHRKKRKQQEEQWRKMALPSVSCVFPTDTVQNNNNGVPQKIPSPNSMSPPSNLMDTNYVDGDKDGFMDNLTNLNVADDIILDDIIGEMHENGSMKVTAGGPGLTPMGLNIDDIIPHEKETVLPPPQPNKKLAADYDNIMLEMTDLTPTGFDQADATNVTQGQYDENDLNEDEMNPNIHASDFIIGGSERDLAATTDGPNQLLQ